MNFANRSSYGVYFHLIILAFYTVFLICLTCNAVYISSRTTPRGTNGSIFLFEQTHYFERSEVTALYFDEIENNDDDLVSGAFTS